jgi:hypothetical protein
VDSGYRIKKMKNNTNNKPAKPVSGVQPKLHTKTAAQRRAVARTHHVGADTRLLVAKFAK